MSSSKNLLSGHRYNHGPKYLNLTKIRRKQKPNLHRKDIQREPNLKFPRAIILELGVGSIIPLFP